MPIPAHIKKLRDQIGRDLLIVPAVSAIVLNDAGEVLLQRARHDGNWYLPGGIIEPGEQPADTAVRELFEEAGLRIEPIQLVETVMEPTLTYSNGDRADFVVTGFLCRIVDGELKISDEESLELKFFKPSEAPRLYGPHQQRLEHALSGAAGSFLLFGHRINSSKKE